MRTKTSGDAGRRRGGGREGRDEGDIIQGQTGNTRRDMTADSARHAEAGERLGMIR